MYFNSYALPLFMTGTIMFFLAFLIFKNQRNESVKYFPLLVIAVGLHSIFYAFEISSRSHFQIFLFYKLQYIGITAIYPLYLIFSILYTGRGEWLSRTKLAIIFLIPVLSLILVLSNNYHYLFLEEHKIIYDSLFPAFSFTPGIGYWLIHSYGIVAMIIGSVLFGIMLINTSKLFRQQIIIILLGSLIPFMVFILYLFNVFPEAFDPTPYAFAFSVIFIFVGLSRYKLFDISPLGRSMLFENLNDGVILLDNTYRIIDYNKSAKSILKLSPESIGETISTILEFWKDFFDDDNKIIKGKHVELKLLSEEKENWFDVRVTNIFDHTNTLVGYIVYLQNITYRKLIEEDMRKKNEELNLSNNEKDKFLSILSHDLRSPFSAIIGYSELMIADNELTASEIREYSFSINNIAVTTYSLMENLLEWSRLRRGLLVPDFKPTNMKTLIDQTINQLHETARNKEITIINEVPNLKTINADVKMMGSVVRNLLSNAIKFSYRGGKVTIASYFDENKKLIFKVIDTGVGMNDETQKYLFQISPKVRTAGTEGESSSGLGLMLCKEFVELHKGKIWVESKVGEGSCFYFSI